MNDQRSQEPLRGKKIVMSVVIVISVMLIVFFITRQEKSEVIKIVTSFPMTKTSDGLSIVKGIQLALKEANYEAGGYALKLIEKDDGDENGAWQATLEAVIAAKAVADNDVMVYLGPYNSGAAKVSIPITNLGNLVQISPGTTWPGLTQSGFLAGEPDVFYPSGKRTFFRVVPTDALQGPAGAVWAKELGFNNIYIFDDGEAYGAGIAGLFEAKCKELGLNVVGRQFLDLTQDITLILDNLKEKDIDLIYFGGITVNGAGALARGIKERKLKAVFMGPDGILGRDFINAAGSASEGTYATSGGFPPQKLSESTQKGKLFYDKYKEEYQIEPGEFSGFGYEAAKVALLAIERAGIKDRAKILEEVSKIKDYDGLLGKWSFDENGDTTLTIISGSYVQNGVFVFKKVLAANVKNGR